MTEDSSDNSDNLVLYAIIGAVSIAIVFGGLGAFLTSSLSNSKSELREKLSNKKEKISSQSDRIESLSSKLTSSLRTINRLQSNVERLRSDKRDLSTKLAKIENKSNNEPSRQDSSDEPEPEQSQSAQDDKSSPPFELTNLSYSEEFSGLLKIIGEIENKTDRDFRVASFTLSVYDEDGNLLDTVPVLVSNFASGSTKSFSGSVETSSEPDRVKLQFENL